MGKSIPLTSKDSDGNVKKLIIKKPNHKQLADAQFYSASAFNRARAGGLMLKSNLDAWLEDQKLFTKEDREMLEEADKIVRDGELALTTKKNPDGSSLKLSQAKDIAINMNFARIRQRLLLTKKQAYDEYTIEGYVENSRFDYLIFTCVFDEEGNKVFSDIEDYYDKKDEPYAEEAAFKLQFLVFDVDEDWQKKTIENEFLRKYKFVDDELNFIGKDGEPVNLKGEKLEPKTEEIPSVDTTEFDDDVYV